MEDGTRLIATTNDTIMEDGKCSIATANSPIFGIEVITNIF